MSVKSEEFPSLILNNLNLEAQDLFFGPRIILKLFINDLKKNGNYFGFRISPSH